ncbi:MAG: hypothetical protein J4F29_05615 [Candidatus Latescibacteria bacterium]|nr:hypothetical protein [Candidatus Latescibacterota bacterium]
MTSSALTPGLTLLSTISTYSRSSASRPVSSLVMATWGLLVLKMVRNPVATAPNTPTAGIALERMRYSVL